MTTVKEVIYTVIGRYVYQFDPTTGEALGGIANMDWEFIFGAIVMCIMIKWLLNCILTIFRDKLW